MVGGTCVNSKMSTFPVGPTNTSGQTGFPIHVTNLVGKGNWNGNKSWRIGYKSSGSNPATFLTFGYGIAWSAGPELSVGSFDLSQWNYFVGVATATQQLLYLNGVLKDTKNLTKISVVNTDPLQLGRASYIDRFFSGNIAMVHIYNSALSSDDILQNFNATKWRFNP